MKVIILFFLLFSVTLVAGAFDSSTMISLTEIKPGVALLNPPQGVIADGNEFSVEVAAYPKVNLPAGEARFNHYALVLYYDPNVIQYATILNLREGLELKEEVSAGVIRVRALRAFEGYYTNEPTRLARITFVARRPAQRTELSLQSVEIVNTYGDRGGRLEVITERQAAVYQIISQGDSRSGSGGSCKRNCDGKQCGTDGCGGFCGDCPRKQTCVDPGVCRCFVNCDGKQCGDNGCGGSCGACLKGQECKEVGLGTSCVASLQGGQEQQEATKMERQLARGTNWWWILLAMLLLLASGGGLYYYMKMKVLS